MAPVVRRVQGHHDVVTDADADLLQAARAQVRLAGLEGVNERDFEVVVGVAYSRFAAHATNTAITTTTATIIR
jgi:hypothetical protein